MRGSKISFSASTNVRFYLSYMYDIKVTLNSYFLRKKVNIYFVNM